MSHSKGLVLYYIMCLYNDCFSKLYHALHTTSFPDSMPQILYLLIGDNNIFYP